MPIENLPIERRRVVPAVRSMVTGFALVTVGALAHCDSALASLRLGW